MLAKKYTQALYELVEGKTQKEQNAIWGGFVGLLKREGHYRLLPNILSNFELLKNSNLSQAVIFVDNENSLTKHKKEIEGWKKDINVEEFETKIDSTLVGGFKIKTKSVLIDASYKKILKDLYIKMLNIGCSTITK